MIKSFLARTLTIGCLMTAAFFHSSAQEIGNIHEIEDLVLSNRPTLLVFSGSDWCMPCMRLEKEILSHQRFIAFSQKHIAIIKADFPQRKKQSNEAIKRNEQLAEKYNPKGEFPKVLLLQKNNSKGEILDYTHWSVDIFIQEIRDKIKARTHSIFEQQELLMGSQFGFTIVDTTNSQRADYLLNESKEIVRRLEYLISEWIDTSEVSMLNKNAGKLPVRVDPELHELIIRSKMLSEISQGAFDITFAGLGHLWKFDGQSFEPPTEKKIRESLNLIGHDKIEIRDSNEVFLTKEGMKIGFGGMGKGYSADKVKEYLIAEGIEDGIINAGGDLVAWGNPPGEEFWKIAIADPLDKNKILCWLPINNSAVATSGDYENYLIIDGKRYAHIIDPKTGYPTSGIKSTTVISSSAELSDVLATAIFVLGIETGMDLIEQLPHAECLIIDSENNIHFSSNLNYIKSDS